MLLMFGWVPLCRLKWDLDSTPEHRDMDSTMFSKRRNKARLTTGEIVEYDEAIEVDPENPEPPEPSAGCKTKYLGVGEIVEAQGVSQTRDGRLVHLWEYLDAHWSADHLVIFDEADYGSVLESSKRPMMLSRLYPYTPAPTNIKIDPGTP